jgi:hypothetical protein
MANSEAIAWYVEEGRRLLEEQQRRAESCQARAGQIAGFGAVLLALIGGNSAAVLHETHGIGRACVAAMLIGAALCLAGSVAVAVVGASKSQSYAAVSAEEIAMYLTDPFLDAPDLWRVQVRSIRVLRKATEDAQKRADSALKSITISLYSFLGGLAFAVGVIAVLTVELI